MPYKQEQWDEAKRRCRLEDKDIRIAKKLWLNPQSLIKNIPNKKAREENMRRVITGSVRVAHGMYRTTEEQKKYLDDGLRRPLP